MAGTASAAKLITGKQIRNSSITGTDIKNKSLTTKDFKGSVKGPAGPAGPQGAQGPAGPAGPAGGGRRLRFSASTGEPRTTVFDEVGMKIEANCIGGNLTIEALPRDDHGEISIYTLQHSDGSITSDFDDDFNIGDDPISLQLGPASDVEHGHLVYSSKTGTTVTLEYIVDNAAPDPQGRCLFTGNVQIVG